MKTYYVGTAGWQLPAELKKGKSGSSGLEIYARYFNCVEINSTFYRNHKAATFAKWADAVPGNFRFSIKLSKVITHEKKLKSVSRELREFMGTVKFLKKKLGCILVQLPPSLQYDKTLAERFFTAFRKLYKGAIKLEARHASWEHAGPVLKKFRIDGVFADPGDIGLVSPLNCSYLRLHGTPKIYKSSYDLKSLRSYAAFLQSSQKKFAGVWCIFDNTMYGFASHNALKLLDLLHD
jgi:uncharacterized protein YecE (DUF72 family)